MGDRDNKRFKRLRIYDDAGVPVGADKTMMMMMKMMIMKKNENYDD